jgi:hypothetical protein
MTSMRKHLPFIMAAATVLAGSALAGALPGTASAHEPRDIGKYHFVVGFINEPAIVEQPNGIDLTVTDIGTKQPVEGLEKTLKAQFVVGGATQDVALRARFGQPGKYTADVIPTKAGTWKFHFTGQINGDNVDQMFESGPGRFNDVQPKDSLQFPAKEPTLLEVANQTAAAKSAADSAKSSANGGMVVGIIGIVTGALGLTAGGLALMQARRMNARASVGGTTGRAAGQSPS